jgi:hypothetical protein
MNPGTMCLLLLRRMLHASGMKPDHVMIRAPGTASESAKKKHVRGPDEPPGHGSAREEDDV